MPQLQRYIPLSIFLGFLVIINTSHAAEYQQGSYPRFAQAQLFTTGESVSEKPNVVLNAIENGDAIDLRYDGVFKSAKQLIFPQQEFGSSYNIDRLASAGFIDTLSDVVSNFACAEYRFRKHLPEKKSCNAYVTDRDIVEHMPFVSGQYTKSRIEANVDDKKNRISFYAFLPSTEEYSLDSAFGSVHELGTFFGRFADRNSLILSVHLQTYWLDSNDLRKEKINAKPSVYFIVLPKAVDIAKQSDEKAAAKYALANAKLLILKQ